MAPKIMWFRVSNELLHKIEEWLTENEEEAYKI